MVCQIYLVVGLAGSGKTTFTSAFKDGANRQNQRVYVVNLDPATENLPYTVNLDIRDTVNYKAIMQDRKMGPNGAIILALNLFLTKVQQLSQLLEGKLATHDYVLIDTPGQIEIFTWSAAGDIMCEMLKKLATTSGANLTILYLIDERKRRRTGTAFTAGNLLHASGLKYRMDVPLEIVFTKVPPESNNKDPRDKGESDDDDDDQGDFAASLHRDIRNAYAPLFNRFARHYVGWQPYEQMIQR